MIEEEGVMKRNLSDIRKQIKEMLAETREYKAVYETALNTDGLEVSEKAARAHAHKVAYEFFSPNSREIE